MQGQLDIDRIKNKTGRTSPWMLRSYTKTEWCTLKCSFRVMSEIGEQRLGRVKKGYRNDKDQDLRQGLKKGERLEVVRSRYWKEERDVGWIGGSMRYWWTTRARLRTKREMLVLVPTKHFLLLVGGSESIPVAGS